jgi:hypothetical protein
MKRTALTPSYIVSFVTCGEDIYSSRKFEAADDVAAMEVARGLHISGLGNGYDLRHGPRLVASVRLHMSKRPNMRSRRPLSRRGCHPEMACG